MESVVSILASGTVSNYVDGEWRQSPGDAVESVEDSATGEVLAEVPGSTTAEVDAAVEGARAAFEDWHERPVEERIQPLFRFKQQLESRQESLAETLVREHGKTFDEAMGELRRGIENLEVATGVPSLTQSGHLPNAAPEIDETAVRKPLGVFGAITPFNFPGMIPLWFLPYAVAAGNTFVLKPSEKTPLTATRLLSLLAETDLPDGVVNLVNGGPDTVDALLEHPTVEGVSFVGSTAVAEHVYETAAAHGKRVQAQGGAKNHVVVAPSASLSFAAEGTVGSAFANSGQRCLANPIAIVVDDVYDEFESLVVEAAADLEVGPGMVQGVEMGHSSTRTAGMRSKRTSRPQSKRAR